MTTSQRRRQAGAGLLEILIVLLVISIGLLTHMRFQKTAYRETGLSMAQMLATELAVEKIDDLRSFSVLATTAGQRAYQDIADDTGGVLPAGSVTVDNQDFNRSWDVANWYYPSPGAAPTTTVPAGNPLPDLKRVTVTLTWVDLNNEVQSYSLSSLVARADPRSAAGLYP
jgi:Tfp pilus assembly protein PilV